MDVVGENMLAEKVLHTPIISQHLYQDKSGFCYMEYLLW